MANMKREISSNLGVTLTMHPLPPLALWSALTLAASAALIPLRSKSLTACRRSLSPYRLVPPHSACFAGMNRRGC
jgi:hypothetical protein